MEERLSAVLSGTDRLSGDIADIAEELGDLADDAIDAALGLERTEDAADDLARSLDDVGDEIDEVATSAAVATASVGGLDAVLSDLETDVGIDIDAGDLDALTLDAEDLSTAVSAVPSEAALAQSALAELAEEDLQFDADVDVDTQDISRQVALSVDRSGLQQALTSIDDDEVDVHPVLRDLRGTLADFDAGEATVRAAVTEETTDLEAPYSAALSAVQALDKRADELDATIVSANRAAGDLPDRVSVDIQGDVEDIVADLRTTEARLRSLDGRTIEIDVDREDLGLPDADEFDLRAAVDASTAEADLAALRSEFLSLPDEETISLDSDADLAGITAMATAIASLPDETTVPIETDMALRGTDRYQAPLDDIRDSTAEIDVGFDVNAPDTRRSALGLGAVSIPVDLDLRQRVDDVIDRLNLSSITAQTDAVERKVTMDISLGDSERDVLSDLAEIHAALASLPDDDRVSIHTESDLDALVATLTGLDSIPDEVRSAIDVDALTGDAQTALTAVLAQAETIDDLDRRSTWTLIRTRCARFAASVVGSTSMFPTSVIGTAGAVSTKPSAVRPRSSLAAFGVRPAWVVLPALSVGQDLPRCSGEPASSAHSHLLSLERCRLVWAPGSVPPRSAADSPFRSRSTSTTGRSTRSRRASKPRSLP
jgi:hypothetical protein